MKQKIVGVLGLGIFGQTIAAELSEFGQEVIAIDSKEQHIQEVADFVSKAAIGDISDMEILKNTGIDQCDVVIIATGNNLESSVLAVMHCKKLGIPRIIAKARSSHYEEVLYEIGADLVISPERESGKVVASDILRHTIAGIYHFEGDVSIVEFKLPKEWIGKTVQELDVRRKYDLNLIGTRISKSSPLDTSIPIDEPFDENAIIVAIANSRTFEKYDYLGYFN
ncbi:potassium channel family protein [Streptococcus sp. CSL10205-OR2]|uniref:potassium channel family protein n=1 Tax=Streptococcus sp. CSL10205-OR2 TaxID=2980558 RepID=UPI0021DB52B5|nr:TrkA family potassium uptake protein [Streptococcus sp. CSL10205-OR2]MCU9533012.1 TrkA family potassium uptake protein [Streptococcus sp. CSL10205-OR2]